MKTLSLTVSSFASTSLSHCFSLLSTFLYSKPFRNNQMHCEIVDHYFNLFFAEIHLKKENLKSVFWAPEFEPPNWYIGLPNSLNTSLHFHFLNKEIRKNRARSMKTKLVCQLTTLIFFSNPYFGILFIIIVLQYAPMYLVVRSKGIKHLST